MLLRMQRVHPCHATLTHIVNIVSFRCFDVAIVDLWQPLYYIQYRVHAIFAAQSEIKVCYKTHREPAAAAIGIAMENRVLCFFLSCSPDDLTREKSTVDFMIVFALVASRAL